MHIFILFFIYIWHLYSYSLAARRLRLAYVYPVFAFVNCEEFPLLTADLVLLFIFTLPSRKHPKRIVFLFYLGQGCIVIRSALPAKWFIVSLQFPYLYSRTEWRKLCPKWTPRPTSRRMSSHRRHHRRNPKPKRKSST